METTFQRENLVSESMRYLIFIPIIKTPLKPNFLSNILLQYFWRSGFIFKLVKTCIPPKVGKNEKKLKKKVSVLEKKNLGSDTNTGGTEIGPWFRFSIPKPNFGLTLATMYLALVNLIPSWLACLWHKLIPCPYLVQKRFGLVSIENFIWTSSKQFRQGFYY